MNSSVTPLIGAAIIAITNIAIAVVVYKLFSSRQSTIQRLTYLAKLEDQISELMNKELARLETEKGVEKFRFRNVLDEKLWDADFTATEAVNRNLYIDGDNYVLIRPEDGARLSSAALHEALIWFKQLNRALESKVIRPNDLLIFWQYIICFAQSGRYGFFKRYFGGIEGSAIPDVCKKAFYAYKPEIHALPENVINCIDDEFLSDVKIKRANLKTA